MPAYQSALVFDHGGRRIGVAVADRRTGLASPLTTLPARDGVPEWPAVERLIREWRPECLVVGVPYNAGAARPGHAGDSESAAGRFADALMPLSGLPVLRVDERLSSVEAEARLRDQRRTGLRRRKVRAADVDAVAASVIAEIWLRDLHATERPTDAKSRPNSE